MWSLAISLVEIACGSYPYPPETFTNVFAQLQAIVEGEPPQLPHPSATPITITTPQGTSIDLELGSCEYSDAARDFVSQCLRKTPDDRPSYASLLEHEFVAHASQVDMAAWVHDAYSHRRQLSDKDAAAPASPSSSA